MPPRFSRPGISAPGRGGENVLPSPVAPGGRVLPLERVGEKDLSIAVFQVPLVEGLHRIEMVSEGWFQRFGEHRMAVTHSFALPDQDLIQREIEVLHPNAERLQEPPAGSVAER